MARTNTPGWEHLLAPERRRVFVSRGIQMPAVRALLPWILLALVPACGASPAQPEFAPAAPLLPGPPGAARLAASAAPPEELPGITTADLDATERARWWRLVSELYAPCPDQAVSIAQCVKEARPCAACSFAGRLIADKVRAGASNAAVEGAYAVRFGPNVKRIDAGDSPSRGPADAPVTIVVWSDFECGACGRAVPLLERIAQKNPNVRLVHKFYPLKRHLRAPHAARAAVAAMNQGKYWEMERLIFENQHALADADLEGYARSLGLDLKRYRSDLTSQRTTDLLARDRAAADAAGLTGTPFILVNGREFDTAYFRLDTDLEPWLEAEVELARPGP